MQLRLLGWPEDGPRLALDHERFAYAGHFSTGRTGLAVALAADVPEDIDPDDGSRTHGGAGDSRTLNAADVLAAASFDGDHAVDDALRVRYVAVREDRRGEGVGPRLLRFVLERAGERARRVRIGVNNPIAYQACYRAGFAFTGETSGVGELVLEAPTRAAGESLEADSPPDAAVGRDAGDRLDAADRSDDGDRPDAGDTVSDVGPDAPGERYREGLALFADRELPAGQRSVVERHSDDEPPALVDGPR